LSCLVAVALLTACSAGVQDAADKEAAAYAHENLRADLESRLAAIGDPQQRPAAAEKLLGGGPEGLVPASSFWWTPGARRGATIPVVVYFYRDETVLSDGPAWGRACQDFVIGDQVQVRSTDCPDRTPASPGLSAISPP